MNLMPKKVMISEQRKIFEQKFKYLTNIFKYFQESYLNEKADIKANSHLAISDFNEVNIRIITKFDFNEIILNKQYIEYFNNFKSIITFKHLCNHIVTMDWINHDYRNNSRIFYIIAYIDCNVKIDQKALTLLQLFQLN